MTSWSGFGVFIVNLEHISHPVLAFLLLIINFEQANPGRVCIHKPRIRR